MNILCRPFLIVVSMICRQAGLPGSVLRGGSFGTEAPGQEHQPPAPIASVVTLQTASGTVRASFPSAA